MSAIPKLHFPTKNHLSTAYIVMSLSVIYICYLKGYPSWYVYWVALRIIIYWIYNKNFFKVNLAMTGDIDSAKKTTCRDLRGSYRVSEQQSR